MERRDQLKAFHHLLNTAEGVMLMDELEKAWHTVNPLDPIPQTMGFNIGLSEAFKQLEVWQRGEGLHE